MEQQITLPSSAAAADTAASFLVLAECDEEKFELQKSETMKKNIMNKKKKKKANKRHSHE